MAVVTLVGFIGYAFRRHRKILSRVRVPENGGSTATRTIRCCAHRRLCTHDDLYVLLGGLEAVVITHIFQTIILMTRQHHHRGIAYMHLTPEQLAAIDTNRWRQSSPVVVAPMGPFTMRQRCPAATRATDMFGLLVLVWVAKGLLLNLGGPGQMFDFQMFLSTRDSRDAAKVGAAWSGFLIVRWAMVMGIALLAIAAGIELVADSSGQIDAEIVMPKVLRNYLRLRHARISACRPSGRVHVDLCRHCQCRRIVPRARLVAAPVSSRRQ